MGSSNWDIQPPPKKRMFIVFFSGVDILVGLVGRWWFVFYGLLVVDN